MSTPVALRGLARSWADGTRALHPTDLDLPAGAITAVLGPSGCGKTTLLRLIAGLLPPDPGGLVLFGTQDMTARPAERRPIGMVFQSYALFPGLDVAGNVAYGLRARGVPRAERERRTRRMLELVRLTEFAHRPVSALSGGQKQRVALARALAPEPAVLLLDEPLAALDARLREEVRLELATLLAELTITTVFVTHDQAEAMALGAMLVVMNAGRVVQAAPPREVYARPADRFVAGFVGELNDLPDGSVCRPEALRLDPEGGLEGRITAAFFTGGSTRLVLEAAGSRLVLDHAGPAPGVGQAVRIAVDRALTFRLGQPRANEPVRSAQDLPEPVLPAP